MEIQIPKIGVEDGDVLIQRWAKPAGSFVQKDEIIAILETDKVVNDLPSPGDGVLEIVVAEGQRARMTEVIGFVRNPQEEKPLAAPENEQTRRAAPSVRRLARSMGVELSDIAADSAHARVTRQDVLKLGPKEAKTADQGTDSFIRATPLARDLSRQWALDLSTIEGSGPDRAVLADDVRRAEAAAGTSSEHQSLGSDQRLGQRRSLPPIRQAIARNLVQSLAETAQMTLMGWFDVGALLTLYQALQEDHEYLGVSPSWSAIFVRVLAVSLTANPVLNGFLTNHEWVQWDAVNIGLAVATDRGLLVPVIRQADQKSLVAIHREAAFLAIQAREGRLSPDDMNGGTVTLSNFGSFGGEWGTPILHRGQSGLLGIGAMEKHPIVDQDNHIVVGYRMPYSLTVDHRAIDGAVAGSFVKTLKEMIARPTRLM
ncbi:MAG: dihydrolipoamide acetyltransferase family protein [Sulfobacillus sp.]